MQSPARRPRPSREAIFVRVKAPDDTVQFHNATSSLGKKMPFTAPQAVCTMRANSEVVSFAFNVITKNSVKAEAEKVLEIYKPALARLERRASSLNKESVIGVDTVVVEMSNGPGEEPSVYRMKAERDENNVLSLENIDDSDDVSFTLQKSGVRLSIYTRSPGTDRLLAVGFYGHMGKPETSETVRRVASKALFSLTQLTEFKILSGIETVSVPMASARFVPAPSRKPSEKATVTLPVTLFTDDNPPAEVADGTVEVTIDLESANPTSNRLLFHMTPSESIEEVFADYRSVLDADLSAHLYEQLGQEDVANITYDIVLGDITSETIKRLREALLIAEPGYRLTPSMRDRKGW